MDYLYAWTLGAATALDDSGFLSRGLRELVAFGVGAAVVFFFMI
jgi:hypothetical protein